MKWHIYTNVPPANNISICIVSPAPMLHHNGVAPCNTTLFVVLPPYTHTGTKITIFESLEYGLKVLCSTACHAWKRSTYHH